MLGVVLALTTCFAFQARQLRLEAGIDLLSADDPVVREDRRRLETFGQDFRLLLALYRPRENGGVLRRPSLVALRELHATLEGLPGVARVSSLASAPILVEPPEEPPFGSLPMPAPVPGEPVLLDAFLDQPRLLSQRLRSSAVQYALLLSLRESLTPLLVELSGEVPEAELTLEVFELVDELEERHPDAGTILVVGPAVVETGLAGHVFDDLSSLVPFSVALVAGGLLLAFRRRVFLVVVLLHAVALEALVLGGMAMLGWTVNLVSVLAPVLLVPVGVADLLHLFARLRATDGADAAETRRLLTGAFEALQTPMLATTATTTLGFLSFLLSPVAAIRQFGITLAIGSVLALLLTFTLDAAVLALAWRPGARRGTRRRTTAGERLLFTTRSPPVLLHRARGALVLAAIFAALGASALSRIRIEDTWIRNFDPESRVIRDTGIFERVHLGTNVLSLVYTADPSVPGSRARALDAVNRFSTAHTVTLGSRGSLAPTMLVRALGHRQNPVWEPWPTPSVEEMTAGLEAWRHHGMALPRVDSLITTDLRHLQVHLFVLNQPYEDLVQLLEELVAKARHSAGPGVQVSASGNLAVNVRMVREAVLGQVRSLLVLLGIVILSLMLMARSVVAGFVLTLPMILAIGGSFYVLMRLDLPYGIAVSMFPPLVVGLSVDFAIHLRAVLERCRAASRTRWARELAIILRGITWNGVLWAAGFALLTVSSLPPNRYLGLLCGLVVVLSTIFTVGLLPAFALSFRDHPARKPRRPLPPTPDSRRAPEGARRLRTQASGDEPAAGSDSAPGTSPAAEATLVAAAAAGTGTVTSAGSLPAGPEATASIDGSAPVPGASPSGGSIAVSPRRVSDGRTLSASSSRSARRHMSSN